MSRTSRGVTPTGGARPIRAPYGWPAYLLAGGALTLAAPLLSALSPVLDALCWVVIQGSSAAAVIAGIRRNGLGRLWAWRLIGVTVTLAWVGSAAFWGVGWTWLEIPLFRHLYQVSTLVTYGLGLTALVLIGLRTSGSRRAGLLDGAIITVGVALPFWAFFINPVIDRSGYSGAELAFALSTPVIDLFLLGMVLRMASDNGRAPWLVLLSASYVSLFVADAAYLLALAANRPAGAVSMVGWLGWAVLVGGSALHPSVAGTQQVTTPVVSGRARITVFLALASLGPLTAGAGIVITGHDRAGSYDGTTVIVLTVLLAVLLVLRLNLVAHLAEDRARTLDRQAGRLTVQAHRLADTLHHQELLQRSLAHRASHDPLTGLANRALFTEVLQAALADPGPPAPSLLLLDLDDFKDVNDAYGHPVGDDLLLTVAHRLRALTDTPVLPAGTGTGDGDGDGTPPEATRTGRTLARLGGDEFALLLTGAAPRAAAHLADQILTALRAPYHLHQREIHLTASIGLLTGTPTHSPTDALRDADLALHAAKTTGKNRAVRFSPDLRTRHLRHVHLAHALRHARSRGELTLAYQPIIDLATGAPTAVEALLRWHPADGTPIGPGTFIPIAEATDLITELGHWVLTRATADAAAWHRTHRTAVTVNVSGRQLRDPAFPGAVAAALRAAGLPPHALILEITENTLLATTPDQTARLTAALARLRESGVRIALDDFGTGYSSLAYLPTLPVDILKIDRSFTTSPAHTDHHRTRAFTKAILDISASLDLTTIVEGVETPDQADLLRTLGARLAQGHLFCRPVPADRVPGLLAAAPWHPTLT
ncbi:hypothetical protein GCM10010466_61040 [Planomonospora alba]|uniref:Uncharacterized protein n=1 Tax=Planomonospora alba TaxID=161354 RepID=A0ABP6NYQ5_9ACTN